MIIIEKDPKSGVYHELIELAFEVCDEFHLVLRNDMGNLKHFEPVLEQLNDSFKEMNEQSEWASNILADNQTAMVYYYYTDDNAKEIIKDLSDSLFGWVFPNLPEDLSFFKDGKEWLATNSHECESYVLSTNPNELKRITNIKGLIYREE